MNYATTSTIYVGEDTEVNVLITVDSSYSLSGTNVEFLIRDGNDEFKLTQADPEMTIDTDANTILINLLPTTVGNNVTYTDLTIARNLDYAISVDHDDDAVDWRVQGWWFIARDAGYVDGGTCNQAMTIELCDGYAINVSFALGGIGGGSPGGASGDIQWNSSGAFAGGAAKWDALNTAILNVDSSGLGLGSSSGPQITVGSNEVLPVGSVSLGGTAAYFATAYFDTYYVISDILSQDGVNPKPNIGSQTNVFDDAFFNGTVSSSGEQIRDQWTDQTNYQAITIGFDTRAVIEGESNGTAGAVDVEVKAGGALYLTTGGTKEIHHDGSPRPTVASSYDLGTAALPYRTVYADSFDVNSFEADALATDSVILDKANKDARIARATGFTTNASAFKFDNNLNAPVDVLLVDSWSSQINYSGLLISYDAGWSIATAAVAQLKKALSIDAETLTLSADSLIVSKSTIRPEGLGASDLGSSTDRWGGVYGLDGNFATSLSVGYDSSYTAGFYGGAQTVLHVVNETTGTGLLDGSQIAAAGLDLFITNQETGGALKFRTQQTGEVIWLNADLSVDVFGPHVSPTQPGGADLGQVGREYDNVFANTVTADNLPTMNDTQASDPIKMWLGTETEYGNLTDDQATLYFTYDDS